MAATQQGAITPTSQAQNIKDYLLSGKSLTALEALGLFRCFRLAARIEQLRKQGMKITTEICKDITNKTYAKYTYVSAVKELEVGAAVRVLRDYPSAGIKNGDTAQVLKVGATIAQVKTHSSRWLVNKADLAIV